METFKAVDGFVGFYEVSNQGTVRSVDRLLVQINGRKRLFPGRMMRKAVRPDDGYNVVQLFVHQKGFPKYVHRLVAEAFIGNPDGKKQVNHIDGNKSNNNVSNLEWCSASENCKHALANGLYQTARGESSGRAQLTDLDVIEIRRLYANGDLQKHIARRFSIGKSAIHKIVHRQRWKHVI